MKYQKFTVEGFETTPSGSYALYTLQDGGTAMTADFGFSIGDVVEWWDWDGYCPSKIKVNGNIIWTEEDKKEWWATKVQRHNNRMKEICQSKGLCHRKYNPIKENNL